MEMHQRCAMVMVARDEIEPPTPACSGPLTDGANRSGINHHETESDLLSLTVGVRRVLCLSRLLFCGSLTMGIQI